MPLIAIDIITTIKKLETAVRPAIQNNLMTEAEAAQLASDLLHNYKAVSVLQYNKERPKRDYFMGFACMLDESVYHYLNQLTEIHGENKVEWSVELGPFVLHYLADYIDNPHHLTTTPDGEFDLIDREGTVNSYFLIERVPRADPLCPLND